MTRLLLAGAYLALVLGGCSIERSALGGGRDAGVRDGGPLDSGAGGLDAGTDAARDAGAERRDGGARDAAGDDAGGDDAGPACIPTDETCNGLDDDCDGDLDEGDACECERQLSGGHVYLFCSDAASQSVARSRCTGWGYDLVVIDDMAENELVRMHAASLGDFWIGLSDADTEGEYEWVDGRVAYSGGTSHLYTHWRIPDAPRGNDAYDCVEMDPLDGGYWLDVGCGAGRPFVCELAP